LIGACFAKQARGLNASGTKHPGFQNPSRNPKDLLEKTNHDHEIYGQFY